LASNGRQRASLSHFALVALAPIIVPSAPASADLIFGEGWDLVDAGGYGAATQFTIPVPAFLEFTTATALTTEFAASGRSTIRSEPIS